MIGKTTKDALFYTSTHDLSYLIPAGTDVQLERITSPRSLSSHVYLARVRGLQRYVGLAEVRVISPLELLGEQAE